MPDGERTFLDTNVLVYAVDEAAPDKRERARDVLAKQHRSLAISSQVLSEFYVTVTRKLTRPMSRTDARDAVERLSLLPTIAVDSEIVLDAIEIHAQAQLSYWDGLIVAAARAGGCSRVLTEDLSDGQVIAGVSVENPFD